MQQLGDGFWILCVRKGCKTPGHKQYTLWLILLLHDLYVVHVCSVGLIKISNVFLKSMITFKLLQYFSYMFSQVLEKQEWNHLYTTKEGERPENKAKNRYKNILPCEMLSLLLFSLFAVCLFLRILGFHMTQHLYC